MTIFFRVIFNFVLFVFAIGQQSGSVSTSSQTRSSSSRLLRRGRSVWRIAFCLVLLVWEEWLSQGMFNFAASALAILPPLALQSILWYMSQQGEAERQPGPGPFFPHWTAMAILFVVPAVKGIMDGLGLIRGRSAALTHTFLFLYKLFLNSLSVMI